MKKMLAPKRYRIYVTDLDTDCGTSVIMHLYDNNELQLLERLKVEARKKENTNAMFTVMLRARGISSNNVAVTLQEAAEIVLDFQKRHDVMPRDLDRQHGLIWRDDCLVGWITFEGRIFVEASPEQASASGA